MSMYEPGAPFLDDLNRLRKRNKNLEHAVKQLRNERQVLLRGESERKAQQEMVVTAVAEEAKGLMDAMKIKYEARIMELEGDQTAIVENRVRVALERQLAELTGTAEERARVRAEREREARIESMRRRIGLRILNQQLANGWSAWHEMYSSRVYAIKRLKTCARRLKAPLLVNAFGAIKYQWREVLHARAMESRVGDAEADLRIRIASLEAEVGEAREEMARRLKGAAHEMALALERQRIELSGSMRWRI